MVHVLTLFLVLLHIFIKFILCSWLKEVVSLCLLSLIVEYLGVVALEGVIGVECLHFLLWVSYIDIACFERVLLWS